MRIIDRFIFSDFIKIFLSCVLILWILYIIGDIFGFLDEILRERIPVTDLLAFYFYLSPFILTQIIPISALIAAVFLLGNLNRHNEVTALRASGIGVWGIIRSVLVGGFIICLAVFVLNDRILPHAMRNANRIRYERLDVGKRAGAKGAVVRNVAIYGHGNRIIFAEFDIGSETLKDVIMHQHDPQNDLIMKVSAGSMKWTGEDWDGTDVVVFKLNKKGEFIGEPVISNSTVIAISETPTDFINNQWKPEYMGYRQLKSYIEMFATSSQKTYRRLLVDLNHKISFPFASLVMILVSAPLAISAKRGGALIGMAQGIVVAILYIPVMAVGIALGKSGALPPALGAWMGNIIFGGAGILLIRRF